MLKFLKVRLKRNHTRRELSRLSERELFDIGLAPGDIEDVARRVS